MLYLVKTPWWLKKLYPALLWDIPVQDKTIYLTFDDGPHEDVTPTILNQLQQYNAKATFFCIGNNVVNNPEIYNNILAAGHAVGNHTHNHLNGWKTKDDTYLQNIAEAARHIQSNLFRPPYGRISKFQARLLQQKRPPYNIIMWTVLSGDFDIHLSPEKCLKNVLKNTGAGSIVVFHDSVKAYQRVVYALPRVLAHFSEQGYTFKALENNLFINPAGE